ncbi:MAG: hypothetical protein IJO13_00410 [Lachnospiraceae bacterium]|nr:hypothetical protein [Lachnospiraceae bacterium]
MRREDEVLAVKELGQKIGYGNMMDIAQALWAIEESDGKTFRTGHVATIKPFIKKKKWKDLKNEVKTRVEEILHLAQENTEILHEKTKEEGMEKDNKDVYIKAFYIPCESWYKETIEEKDPYIMIGLYHPSGGTKGEFMMSWENNQTPVFRAYHDSWNVLNEMPELVSMMAEISKNREEISFFNFKNALLDIGYQNLTKAEKPDHIPAIKHA